MTLDIEDVRAARAREDQASRLVDHGDPSMFERVEATLDGEDRPEDFDEETAVKLATELADIRQGKLVKLASFEAADMPVNRDGMTEDEATLVEDLAERMVEWRESVVPTAPQEAHNELR